MPQHPLEREWACTRAHRHTRRHVPKLVRRQALNTRFDCRSVEPIAPRTPHSPLPRLVANTKSSFDMPAMRTLNGSTRNVGTVRSAVGGRFGDEKSSGLRSFWTSAACRSAWDDLCMLMTTCAFCGANSHFTAQAGSALESLDGNRLAVEIAATCDNCGRFNLAHGPIQVGGASYRPGSICHTGNAVNWGDLIAVEGWQPPAMITPSTDFLPSSVAGFVIEAHNANSVGAYRAVLLLVRSIIEATAREKGVDKGTLYGKIDTLNERGFIRPRIKEMAHTLRLFGNDMAHGEIDVTPTAEDASDALTIVTMVLDDIYVADGRWNDMIKRRNLAAAVEAEVSD
jgi:hypothetical protein